MNLHKIYYGFLAVIASFLFTPLKASQKFPVYDPEKFTVVEEIVQKYPMPANENRLALLKTVFEFDTHDYLVCQPEQEGYHLFGTHTVDDGLLRLHGKMIPKTRTEFLDLHVNNLSDIHLESYGIKNCKNILIYNKKTKAFVFFHMALGCLRNHKFPDFFAPTTNCKFIDKNSLEESLPYLGEVVDLKCVITSFTAELIFDVLASIEEYGVRDIHLSCCNILYIGDKIQAVADSVPENYYGNGIYCALNNEGRVHFVDQESDVSALEGKRFIFHPGEQKFWHD